MKERRIEIVGFAAVGLVAVAFWVQSTALSGVSAVFPRAAIAAVFVLACINVVRAAFGPEASASSGALGAVARTPMTRGVAIAVGASIAYVAAVATLGFYSSSAFFLAAMYNWPRAGDPAPKVATIFSRIGIAVAVTGLLFLLFTKGLAVQTPQGLLF